MRRGNKRYLAASLVSFILVVRAAVSLVYFANGGDSYTNPKAIPTLIVVSALGTVAAIAALIFSSYPLWGAGATRSGRALKILWGLCAVLLLIEWTVALGSSG